MTWYASLVSLLARLCSPRPPSRASVYLSHSPDLHSHRLDLLDLSLQSRLMLLSRPHNPVNLRVQLPRVDRGGDNVHGSSEERSGSYVQWLLEEEHRLFPVRLFALGARGEGDGLASCALLFGRGEPLLLATLERDALHVRLGHGLCGDGGQAGNDFTALELLPLLPRLRLAAGQGWMRERYEPCVEPVQEAVDSRVFCHLEGEGGDKGRLLGLHRLQRQVKDGRDGADELVLGEALGIGVYFEALGHGRHGEAVHVVPKLDPLVQEGGV